MSRRSTRPALTVGYVEQIELPEWRVRCLPAKIDTGARTSALHVDNLSFWENGWLTFDVPNSLEPELGVRHIEARLLRKSQVRSTSGAIQVRPVVATRLCLGPLERTIQIGLVDRSRMNYPMLLGRTALAGLCTVDPARAYLL